MKPYYQHAGITIYHGDCREVLPAITGIACIVTSPPYNQLGSRIPEQPTGMWARSHGGAGFARNVNTEGYADDMDEYAYQQWQIEMFTALASASTENASLFYNHQCRWRDRVLLHLRGGVPFTASAQRPQKEGLIG